MRVKRAFDDSAPASQAARMANSARLDAALAAAAVAAELIRASYQGAMDVRTKSDGSPVTDADVAAEQAIRGIVQGRFPEDGFFGEESAADRLDAERIWIVDPIDGTKSFVRRYPMFSTQIALMHRGRLELGVSCAPVFGETAWAERGGGAWMAGAPLAVSRIATIEEATLSTGNLRSLARGPRWAALGRMVGRLDRIRGFGDFLHYHLLAAGKIEAVIESDIQILDIAALTVIVEEAGGRVTDLEGAPIGLESRSILASNSVLHETILGELNSRALRR
ncbi:MAG TPA: inositol monophosphatase family protein [Steroidobacteraceae bacterium]